LSILRPCWDRTEPTLDRLHRDNLTAIAWAALVDGVEAEAERRELDLVATLLLHLPLEVVEDALTDAARTASARQQPDWNCHRALSSSSQETRKARKDKRPNAQVSPKANAFTS